MSDVDTSAIISFLVPALKLSVDHVGEIRKRRKKKKDESAFLEQELEISLGEAEYDIRTAFYTHASHLGDLFRRGDEISSHRIQTQIENAQKIETALKVARDRKRDIEDLRSQWKSAEKISRETVQTMDELGRRITQRNVPPSNGQPPQELRRYDTNTSNTRSTTFEPNSHEIDRPRSISNGFAALPERYRPDMGSSNGQAVPPGPRRYDTAFSTIQPVPSKPYNHDMGASKIVPVPHERRHRYSASSNTMSVGSPLSQEPRSFDADTSNYFPMAGHVPPELFLHDPSKSTSLATTFSTPPTEPSAAYAHQFNQTIVSASLPTHGRMYSEGPPTLIRSASGQENQRNFGGLTPHRDSFSSVNTKDSRRSSGLNTPAGHKLSTQVTSGFISSTGRSKLVGRPDKKNGFHGFCEGAWKIIGDPKKGLSSVTLPLGYYGSTKVLQCTVGNCRFRCQPYRASDKQGLIADPRVKIANCGIQYRFLFLAKSHQRCEESRGYAMDEDVDQKMNSQNYGCLFCNAEGWTTAIYGGVESLMNHISIEHGRDETSGIERLTNCIWGREARREEDFDINIAHVVSPLPDPAAAPPSLFDMDPQYEEDLINFRPLQPGSSAASPESRSSLNYMSTWTYAELAAGGDQSPVELPAGNDTYPFPQLRLSGPAELEDHVAQRVSH